MSWASAKKTGTHLLILEINTYVLFSGAQLPSPVTGIDREELENMVSQRYHDNYYLCMCPSHLKSTRFWKSDRYKSSKGERERGRPVEQAAYDDVRGRKQQQARGYVHKWMLDTVFLHGTRFLRLSTPLLGLEIMGVPRTTGAESWPLGYCVEAGRIAACQQRNVDFGGAQPANS
ncbi:hypothetical protein LX36DRAFT_665480 [Colletotrichum falcatum]|nr:hypothetical protein LX36DRAFT_665480 [Colletotrichum falcatum]